MLENMPLFLSTLLGGLPETVIATAGGMALATVMSFLAGLALLSPSRTVRFVSRVYVEGLRGTSELVQLFWVFFALPILVGINLLPLPAGIAVLGLNFGAYGAEIVRGAVQSVPREQYEAATALNLTPRQRMRRVVLPQALVEMVPPFNNLFIQLLKGTALLSLIFVNDLTDRANALVRLFPQDFGALLMVLVIYLILALLITAGMRTLERKAATTVGRPPSARARKAAIVGAR